MNNELQYSRGRKKLYLDDLGGTLGCTVPQVLSIDGQNFVTVLQFAVFGRQPSRQQIQDEHATLVRFADQLYAERFRALTLGQRHLQYGAGVLRGGRVAVGGAGQDGVLIGARLPGFETFLLHDGEPDEGRLA